MRIVERGGKHAKRRAAVAVARKLAVLLHRLWVSETPYDPWYRSKDAPAPLDVKVEARIFERKSKKPVVRNA
jgi:hypothetical protein